MQQAETQLQSVFANYTSFPGPAQEGLLDMMFNMGPNKFTADKWPSFFAAVNATPPDWNTAAIQSHRTGVSDARNDAVRALFQQAAGG